MGRVAPRAVGRLFAGLSLLLSAEAAAAPPGPVLPAPEAIDAPALFREQRGAELACDVWVEGAVLMCFKIEADGVRRYVTSEDLEAWAVSLSDLREAATGALDESPWTRQEGEGGGGDWWAVDAPASRAAGALLRPEWLAPVGPAPVVGIPEPGTIIAWSAGDPELDQIMAVAIRRSWESAAHPVSPAGFRWDGEGWSVWGEAVPESEQGAEPAAAQSPDAP